jgi:hypothetical protein
MNEGCPAKNAVEEKILWGRFLPEKWVEADSSKMTNTLKRTRKSS